MIESGFGTDELESTWQLFQRILLHLMQGNAADGDLREAEWSDFLQNIPPYPALQGNRILL